MKCGKSTDAESSMIANRVFLGLKSNCQNFFFPSLIFTYDGFPNLQSIFSKAKRESSLSWYIAVVVPLSRKFHTGRLQIIARTAFCIGPRCPRESSILVTFALSPKLFSLGGESIGCDGPRVLLSLAFSLHRSLTFALYRYRIWKTLHGRLIRNIFLEQLHGRFHRKVSSKLYIVHAKINNTSNRAIKYKVLLKKKL